MKPSFTSVAFLLLFTLSAAAQRPVSKGVEKRKVLLEQFTGIHCPACPAAHRIADSLKAVKPPGSLLLMNIHSGAPAVPYPGDPDFRTLDGNAIATAPGLNLTQYPSGTVNKHRFGGITGRAVPPAQWSALIDSIQAQNSPLNIALDGTLNVTTRYLTFTSEDFLRTLASNDTNEQVIFNYFLVEDKLVSPQEGAHLYPAHFNPVNGFYRQDHVLRDELIGGIITQSAFVSKPTFIGKVRLFGFGYSVPQQYGNTPVELGNLRLIMTASYRGGGVVSQPAIYDSNIVTVATGPITLTGFAHTRDAHIKEARINSESCTPALQPFVRIYNNGSQPITTVTLQSSLNGAAPVPAGTFTGSIAPATSALVALNPTTYATNTPYSLAFKITSVNGSPDEDGTNDTLSTSDTFRVAAEAKGPWVAVHFTQDRFGSQSAWQITEQGTGIVKLTGGPYPDLAGNSTALHTDSFRADPDKCYEFVVTDAGGNGINAGTGAGRFSLLSYGNVVDSSNGVFGSRYRRFFKTPTVFLNTSNAALFSFGASVTLSPNPIIGGGDAQLRFVLLQGSAVQVQVIDMAGRVVAQIYEERLSAGTHELPLSTQGLSGGVYQVRIVSSAGTATQKLVVVK